MNPESCDYPRWQSTAAPGNPDAAVTPCETRSGAEACLQPVELGPEYGGQLLTELLEPFLDLRNLGLPFLDVDPQRGLDCLRSHVEALDV